MGVEDATHACSRLTAHSTTQSICDTTDEDTRSTPPGYSRICHGWPPSSKTSDSIHSPAGIWASASALESGNTMSFSSCSDDAAGTVRDCHQDSWIDSGRSLSPRISSGPAPARLLLFVPERQTTQLGWAHECGVKVCVCRYKGADMLERAESAVRAQGRRLQQADLGEMRHDWARFGRRSSGAKTACEGARNECVRCGSKNTTNSDADSRALLSCPCRLVRRIFTLHTKGEARTKLHEGLYAGLQFSNVSC